MMNNYGTPALALSHGSGCTVWDLDGRAYLDLIAGIATCSVGHAHPSVAAAVAQQAGRLMHTSNLFVHEPGLAWRSDCWTWRANPGGSSSATTARRPTRRR